MVHEEIIFEVDKRIGDTLAEVGNMVAETIKGFDEGSIPSAGEACIRHVANVRRNALTRCEVVKTWMGAYIAGTMIEHVRSSKAYELLEKLGEVHEIDAQRMKAEERRSHISDYDNKRSDYEKFQLYEDTCAASRKQGGARQNIFSANADKSVGQIYKMYTAKKRAGLLIGIAATVFFAVLDFNIIYALFQASNFSIALSIRLAVIFAAVLDVPPYILGFLWTKRDDCRQLWRLRGKRGTPEARRDIRRYGVTIGLMVFAIVLLFLIYLVVRILSFLGGGDFNFAFRSVLDGNFKFEGATFSSADLLSAVAPIGTSVAAFAIGMLLYASYTDYVERTVAAINKALEMDIRECNEVIINCKNKCRTLNDEISAMKHEIWAFYMDTKPFPQDDDIYRNRVAVAFRNQNMAIYEQTYEKCSMLLRERAEEMLQDINQKLALYVSDASALMTMPYSEEEKEVLDSFWVKKKGARQHDRTVADVEMIQERMNQILQKGIG